MQSDACCGLRKSKHSEENLSVFYDSSVATGGTVSALPNWSPTSK